MAALNMPATTNATTSLDDITSQSPSVASNTNITLSSRGNSTAVATLVTGVLPNRNRSGSRAPSGP